jgi:hypothetical protein
MLHPPSRQILYLVGLRLCMVVHVVTVEGRARGTACGSPARFGESAHSGQGVRKEWMSATPGACRTSARQYLGPVPFIPRG